MSDLTQEKLLELLHYDPSTGAWTWRVSNSIFRAGDRAGRIYENSRGKELPCRVIYVLGKHHRAARLAWFYMTGKWLFLEIDHVDGDSLNDAWANLREATRSQNNQNRGCFKSNRLRLKGVHRQHGRFRAMIQKDGRRVHLGYFDDAELAHAAYAAAASELHGSYARVT